MQLENSHGGYAGKSLINHMQDTLDKTLQEFESETEPSKILSLQGMVAGMAKMIGILRGTSVKTEISEARQRNAERNKTSSELVQSVNE